MLLMFLRCKITLFQEKTIQKLTLFQEKTIQKLTLFQIFASWTRKHQGIALRKCTCYLGVTLALPRSYVSVMSEFQKV